MPLPAINKSARSSSRTKVYPQTLSYHLSLIVKCRWLELVGSGERDSMPDVKVLMLDKLPTKSARQFQNLLPADRQTVLEWFPHLTGLDLHFEQPITDLRFLRRMDKLTHLSMRAPANAKQAIGSLAD